MNEREIYVKIEEAIQSYGGRCMDKLLAPGDKDMTPEQMFTLRGNAQAAKVIITSLRNTLGYDPDQL